MDFSVARIINIHFSAHNLHIHQRRASQDMGAIKERNGHDLAKVAYDLGEENADADCMSWQQDAAYAPVMH